MYTGLRFIGTVKPEFRESFETIGEYGWWDDSDDLEFRTFGHDDRASFIPCGSLCYMPDKWDDCDEFEKSYNKETGKWTFKCSLKNYENTIEKFIELIPYFIEIVDYCEVLYEEWETSRMYELRDGEMVMAQKETWHD